MDPITPEPRQNCVRDIMTRDIVQVRPDTSVSDIALLMSQHRISGVPVVDEQDRVLGVVTELDMVVRNTRFKLPAFFTLLNATIYLETPAHIKERLRHMLGLTAREIMSERAMTITAGASIEDLAELMVGRRANPIPVVENGRLAGIVSRSDIVRWMAKGVAE
ncbi:MAG TPA: CBS domain-containing protein [Acidobacteriota bacterium]|nr:CBS domain-containing protein [Acidobacteriota bacterium]